MITLTTAAGESDPISWTGGKGTVVAQGSFGTGTFTVMATADGGTTWITLVDSAGATLALTSNGIFTIEIGPCQLKGIINDSSGAEIEFAILPIPQ